MRRNGRGSKDSIGNDKPKKVTDDDAGRTGGARNFANMDPDERRKVARMGGQASHGGHGKTAGGRPSGGRSRSTPTRSSGRSRNR